MKKEQLLIALYYFCSFAFAPVKISLIRFPPKKGNKIPMKKICKFLLFKEKQICTEYQCELSVRFGLYLVSQYGTCGWQWCVYRGVRIVMTTRTTVRTYTSNFPSCQSTVSKCKLIHKISHMTLFCPLTTQLSVTSQILYSGFSQGLYQGKAPQTMLYIIGLLVSHYLQ